MNDEELVELIASRVRARLMAGGSGPAYTRPMPTAGAKPSLKTHSAEELRLLPCDEDPDDCSECGCVVRRPESTASIGVGVSRLGPARALAL